MPLAGNASLARVHQLERQVEACAVHFDLPDYSGVREPRRIGELALAHHLTCTLLAAGPCALFVAALQLAAALPNCVSIECHKLHRCRRELVPTGMFAADSGWIKVPDDPGHRPSGDGGPAVTGPKIAPSRP